MRYSAAAGLVLAAWSIGEAMAGPTHAHLHRHRNVHEKKDLDNVEWDKLGINWESAWAAGQKATPAPVPAPSPIPAPAAVFKETGKDDEKEKKEDKPKDKTPSKPGIADQLDDLWHGLVGASNNRNKFGESLILGGGTDGGSGLAGDFQNGNIGNPYGSNIIMADSIEGYDFTATFINNQSKRISINIWNKGGSDHQPLSGASLAPKDTALTFSLASGGEKIVAFANRSYVAWAEPCEQTAFEGSFATTWGEAKFQSGGSGYDVSAIKNPNGSDYHMEITCPENPCVSNQDQNMWLAPDKPIGDSNGSCYVPGSKLHLTVKMGGRS